MGFCGNNAGLNGANTSRISSVFESLPLAIQWLRETAKQNPSTQFQVKAYAAVYTLLTASRHFDTLITCIQSAWCMIHSVLGWATLMGLRKSVPLYKKYVVVTITNLCTSSLIHIFMYCSSFSESDCSCVTVHCQLFCFCFWYWEFPASLLNLCFVSMLL